MRDHPNLRAFCNCGPMTLVRSEKHGPYQNITIKKYGAHDRLDYLVLQNDRLDYFGTFTAVLIK